MSNKKPEHVEPVKQVEPVAVQPKSKVTDLLAQLDQAFDETEVKAAELARVRARAGAALEKAHAALEIVKAEQQKYIMEADQAAQAARTALQRLRDQVNERVGTLTGVGADPRVNVR